MPVHTKYQELALRTIYSSQILILARGAIKKSLEEEKKRRYSPIVCCPRSWQRSPQAYTGRRRIEVSGICCPLRPEWAGCSTHRAMPSRGGGWENCFECSALWCWKVQQDARSFDYRSFQSIEQLLLLLQHEYMYIYIYTWTTFRRMKNISEKKRRRREKEDKTTNDYKKKKKKVSKTRTPTREGGEWCEPSSGQRETNILPRCNKQERQ